ncbi:MAG: HEAT repeat domain-containing protein [bacterium]|nr:HEAT repeat domain-containing protein [bacterium]
MKLKVSQVQDTSLGIPVYRMPVAVGLHTASGVTSKTVWLNEAVEVFEFDLGEPPLLVRFDEGNHLLKEWTFAKSVDELVYQLHNDDAIGRAWAAMQLGSSIGNASASEALFTAAKQDPFWDVRRSAVLALAGFAGNDHVVVLKECAEDSNSKVRAAALEVMGETGDPGHAEYLKKRFVEDDSYSAQAEALRSLGKIGDRTAIDLLRSATEQESPRNTLAEAAQWALDQMGVEK